MQSFSNPSPSNPTPTPPTSGLDNGHLSLPKSAGKTDPASEPSNQKRPGQVEPVTLEQGFAFSTNNPEARELLRLRTLGQGDSEVARHIYMQAVNWELRNTFLSHADWERAHWVKVAKEEAERAAERVAKGSQTNAASADDKDSTSRRSGL